MVVKNHLHSSSDVHNSRVRHSYNHPDLSVHIRKMFEKRKNSISRIINREKFLVVPKVP